MHILPDTSRSKGNQTKKFSQLIEYNMRNIFLEKSWTKCGGETSPKPIFFKKEKIKTEHIDQQSYSLFLFYVQVEDCQNILKLRCKQLAFISHKAFSKNKKRSGISVTGSFSNLP